MNPFLKKSISSMINLPGEQVEAIFKAAEAFKSSSIDRGLAMEVFDKVSKKSPSEINELLKKMKLML